MSEQPKEEEIKPKEEKKECPKKECMRHKCKERKCECGEIIPKRKEGEPKIKVCPKCGKDLPKKMHGFGMRCHKMRKYMKFMHMMKMMNTCPFGFGFGPRRFGPPSPYGGIEVHHYIHFGPPGYDRPMTPWFGRHMGPPGFGRFCRPPMPPFFGRPPMGPGFGRPMGPPGFGRPPMGFFPHFGPHHMHGPHGPRGPCEKKEEAKKE